MNSENGWVLSYSAANPNTQHTVPGIYSISPILRETKRKECMNKPMLAKHTINVDLEERDKDASDAEIARGSTCHRGDSRNPAASGLLAELP